MPDLLQRVDTIVAGLDAGHADPPDASVVWATLGREGVVREVVDALEHGDTVPVGALLEALDERVGMGVTLSVCVQVATVLPLLRRLSAAHRHAATVLRRCEDGEVSVALAVTDSGSGSSLATTETVLSGEGDSPTIRGRKRWITNTTTCSHALVLARRDGSRHFTSFAWALVPVDLPGVRRSAEPARDFPGAGLGTLELDDVPLAREHLVGRPGRALAEFACHVADERSASALWGRAFARRLLRTTRKHLQLRVSDDERTLWDNAAVRERFARCLVDWASLDAMCRDLGPHPDRLARSAMVKAHSGRVVPAIALECSSLVGADAFGSHGAGVAMTTALAQAQLFDTAGGATGAVLAVVAGHADELLA